MAQGIVDHLEPIKVEEHDGNHFFLNLCTVDHYPELLHQIGPVGQTGQRVMIGQLPDVFLYLIRMNQSRYALFEHSKMDGFWDIVGSAGSESLDDGFFIIQCRNHQYRRISALRHLTDSLTGSEAIHLGHHGIHQDQVGHITLTH